MTLLSAGGKPLKTRAEFARAMRASWPEETLNKIAVHNGLAADEQGRDRVIEHYYRWYLVEAGREDLARERVSPQAARLGPALDLLRDELLAAAMRVPFPKPPRPMRERLFDPYYNARVALSRWRNRKP